MRDSLISSRTGWPRGPKPSSCGRPTPAWPRITCWGQFQTPSSCSLVVAPAPVPVGWPRGANEPPRTSQGSFDPRSVPRVSLVSPPQLLEALVSVVATLGDVVATVTGPRQGVRCCVPPKSLHVALRIFTWSLCKGLEHPGVTSLGQPLATLGATPRATWANVRATGSTWWELVSALEKSWDQVAREATELRDTCENTAPARTRDPQDKATHRGTAEDNLAATAHQLMVALDRDGEASVGATRDAQMAMAPSEAMEENMVATRRARAAIRRRPWAEVALESLQRLVATCDRARLFLSELQCGLGEVKAALEGTNDASPDVPEALVAVVAKFEQLWEASAHLFKHHLLGTLGDIHDLLLSPYDGRGGPNGPGIRAVAERCQKAIEDIPRLLQRQ
nr:uncharacterized protein LOC113460666 isoform X2 [Zonotrichia albicollis]